MFSKYPTERFLILFLIYFYIFVIPCIQIHMLCIRHLFYLFYRLDLPLLIRFSWKVLVLVYNFSLSQILFSTKRLEFWFPFLKTHFQYKILKNTFNYIHLRRKGGSYFRILRIIQDFFSDQILSTIINSIWMHTR